MYFYAELHQETTRTTIKYVLEQLILAVLHKIHTTLTDNGIQFTNRKRDALAFMTPFDRVCHKHGIEHRQTKAKPPFDR